MTTYETNDIDLAGVGPKLLAHSKSAEFTARRGLVVELFPFIFGAAERMSAKSISEFLEKEHGVKLSAVTINKALRDPAKNWNLFFDMIEPSAHIFGKDESVPMSDFLFREKYLFKKATNPVLKAIASAVVSEKMAEAVGVLRNKWYVIDWAVRLKAKPYLEHRMGGRK